MLFLSLLKEKIHISTKQPKSLTRFRCPTQNKPVTLKNLCHQFNGRIFLQKKIQWLDQVVQIFGLTSPNYYPTHYKTIQDLALPTNIVLNIPDLNRASNDSSV